MPATEQRKGWANKEPVSSDDLAVPTLWQTCRRNGKVGYVTTYRRNGTLETYSCACETMSNVPRTLCIRQKWGMRMASGSNANASNVETSSAT
jgi:hypothetical protein